MRVSGRHILAVGVVILAVTAVTACGRSASDAGGTPGFSSKERSVDTKSPFEMANPTTTAGPTTIPGSGPTLPLPTTTDPVTGESAVVGELPPSRTPTSAAAGTPGAPATTVPRSTTTTSLPSTPFLPDPAQIQTICGVVLTLRTFGAVLTNPALDLPTTIVRVRAILDRFQQVSPPEVRSQMLRVREVVNTLADALNRAGDQVNDPAFRDQIGAALSGAPPYQGFTGVVDEIAQYEALKCTPS